ncbi:hypothetical protein ACFQZU_12295, partial [Streptomonospora algeriensis]
LRTPASAGAPAAVLAQTASTPLGLWLLRTVYIAPGADPAPLLDPDRFPTPAALRTHLLDALIPAVVAARPPGAEQSEPFRPRRRHRPDQVRHWLGYMAQHLSRVPAGPGQTGTRDFAWWRLAQHTLHPRTLPLAVGSACGLAGGLSYGLGNALQYRAGNLGGSGELLLHGFLPGLLLGGLVYGVLGGLLPRRSVPAPAAESSKGRHEPERMRLHTRLSVRNTVAFGLAGGIAAGLLGELGVALYFAESGGSEPRFGLGYGLLGGLASGLAGGLLPRRRASPPTAEPPDPACRQATEDSRALARRVTRNMGVFGAAAGIAAGSLIGTTTDVFAGFVFGPGYGLVAALLAGLVTGFTSRRGPAATAAEEPEAEYARIGTGAGRLSHRGARGMAVYGVAGGLVLGFGLGAVTELSAGLQYGLDLAALGSGLQRGAVNGLIGGLVGGLGYGLLARGGSSPWLTETPGFADLRIAGRVRVLVRRVAQNVLLFGILGGLAAAVLGAVVTVSTGSGHALGLVLVAGLRLGLAFALAIAPLAGLVGGLGFGVLDWAETPTPDGRTDTPRANQRADRRLNAVRTTVVGLTTVLLFGLLYGLGYFPLLAVINGSGLVEALLFGSTVIDNAMLEFGLGFGLVYGLGAGSHHAWVAYAVATGRLAWRRRLPRRLMPFLDDAHRLGLLRAVGPVYQFRHAELQDHLARAYRRGAGAASSDGGL